MILNKALQEKFNLPIDHGALIMNEGMPGDAAVVPGSAAEKAGLLEYDVILAFNNKKITEEETLEDIIASCKIGDKIGMEILRQGKKLQKKIVLEEFLLHR